MNKPDFVKAVVMTGPGKVETQFLPYPDHLEPGALIVKMEMSGICGTDKHAFDGDVTLYGGTEAQQNMVYPCVHGHENSGTVFELGGEGKKIEYSGKDLKVGDRITNCPNIICGHCWYCRRIHGYPFCSNHQGVGMTYPSDKFPFLTGGWAEYMYLPPGTFIYKVPEDLTIKETCLSEIFVVSALLERAKNFSQVDARGFGFGDTVVVQGVGAVGMLMIAKARLLGAGKIIALDGFDPKLDLSKEFGADIAINVSKIKDDDLVQIIRDETEGRGADVVVEAVGQPQVLDVGLRMLRRGGTYCETGNFVDTGNVLLNVHRHIAAKNVLLIGNTNHPHDGYYQAMDMMIRNRHQFPFEKLITHQFKLDESKEALKKAYESDALKVVFTIEKGK
jgi:Threonine dehydrogenase and related Zn-dependent dehydrogenases